MVKKSEVVATEVVLDDVSVAEEVKTEDVLDIEVTPEVEAAIEAAAETVEEPEAVAEDVPAEPEKPAPARAERPRRAAKTPYTGPSQVSRLGSIIRDDNDLIVADLPVEDQQAEINETDGKAKFGGIDGMGAAIPPWVNSLVDTAESSVREMRNLFQRMRAMATPYTTNPDDPGIDRDALQYEFERLGAEIGETGNRASWASSQIQIAEDALNETGSVLQKMRALAVRVASGTNETCIDRGALQREIALLQAEIDDTASKARFNGAGAAGDSAMASWVNSLTRTAVDAMEETDGILEEMRALTARLPSGPGESCIDRFALRDEMLALAAPPRSYANEACVDREAIRQEFLNLQAEIDNTVGKARFDDLKNINSAITSSWVSSMIERAEGAFSDTHDILQRMRSLAVRAAPDMSESCVDRDALQREFTQLQAAINSAVNRAAFNDVGDGRVWVSSMIDSAEDALADTQGFLERMRALAVQAAPPDEACIDRSALRQEFAQLQAEIGIAAGNAKFDDMGVIDGAVSVAANAFYVQTGANAGDYLAITIGNMNASELGVASGDASIGERASASAAVTSVNGAINLVSTQRARLGALQNRLQHKINNLNTSAENLSAAESRIRDVDMAKEMTNYMRWTILSQASTAMLAQANQTPQGVLQLLGQ